MRGHLPRQREAFEVRDKKSERKPAKRFREEEEAQRSEGEVPQGGAARDTKLVPTRGRARRRRKEGDLETFTFQSEK